MRAEPPSKHTLPNGEIGAIHKYLPLHKATMVMAFPGRYLMGRFHSSLPGVLAHFVTGEIHRVGVVDYLLLFASPDTFRLVELRGPFPRGVRVWSLSSFRGSSCLVTLFPLYRSDLHDMTLLILPVSRLHATEIRLESRRRRGRLFLRVSAHGQSLLCGSLRCTSRCCFFRPRSVLLKV
jgi:hypothetical protein